MTRIVILAAVGVFFLLLSAALPAGTTQGNPSAAFDESPAERGRQLFAAKGCIGCHWHADLQNDQIETFRDFEPPELTDYEGTAEFLREWLRDPASVRPGTPMPTLGLSDAEIDALVAFLLAEELTAD